MVSSFFHFLNWELVLYIIAISEYYRASVKKEIGIFVVPLIVLVAAASLAVVFSEHRGRCCRRVWGVVSSCGEAEAVERCD